MRLSFLIASMLYIFFGIYVLTVSFYYNAGELFTFFIPLFYFIFTYVAAIYLYKMNAQRLIPRIIYFLLAVSLMYCSSAPANFNDVFAVMLFQTSAMLCLSLLVHFLFSYYEAFGIQWPYFRSIVFFYSFPVILFIVSLSAMVVPALKPFVNWVTLLLFANGLLTIFYILLRGYKQSRKKQLLLLIGSCILPFLPYVLFVAIPQVLLQPPLIHSRWASIFFLLLPFSFLFTQLTERLFGLHYYISRFRYYGTIATVVAASITAVNLLLLQQSLQLAALSFVITACIIYIALYVKEALDFKHRKLLFSANSNTGQSLYNTIAKISSATSAVDATAIMLQEVKDKLHFPYVTIETLDHLPLTIVTKRSHDYAIKYHQNEALVIGHTKQPLTLQHEEIIWLEMVAMYTDALFTNFAQIEQLYEQLAKQANQLPWLQKLVFQYVEEEKAMLARELHDSTLQDILYIARAFEQEADVSMLREQMLDVAYELREYCETLNPPLLATMGLEAALHKLVQKVNMRASFHVEQSLQIDYLEDETLALMIYRVVQELYNNAIKHSTATHVQLSVHVSGEKFSIHYRDNNKNLQNESFTPSMGLLSMQQRVQAFHGSMNILTDSVLTIVLTNEEVPHEHFNRR